MVDRRLFQLFCPCCCFCLVHEDDDEGYITHSPLSTVAPVIAVTEVTRERDDSMHSVGLDDMSGKGKELDVPLNSNPAFTKEAGLSVI